MTVPFTNGVSAERGTSRLRHRWHRLPTNQLCASIGTMTSPRQLRSCSPLWRHVSDPFPWQAPICFIKNVAFETKHYDFCATHERCLSQLKRLYPMAFNNFTHQQSNVCVPIVFSFLLLLWMFSQNNVRSSVMFSLSHVVFGLGIVTS